MPNELPSIYFYIPQFDWPKGCIPENIDTCQPENFRLGAYSWTLQTYLRLKADGFPCKLTNTCPSEGIVFGGRSAFPDNFKPGSRLLMIVHQGDKTKHPYAQLHVVQNLQDRMLTHPVLLWPSYYMRHWPQPGLVPRNPERGDRFENIAYFGREENLASELKESTWREQLEAMGLNWHVVSNPDHWSDYSYVDAVIAVRSFKSSGYSWKPATKLYQTWHAGVPAILGCESAYQSERKSQLDYIEVRSLEDTIVALKQLRDDLNLRRAMIENGRVRAEETQLENLVVQWRNFFTNVAIPAYEQWCQASSLTQQRFLMLRYLAVKTKGMRQSMQKVKNAVGLRTRIHSVVSNIRGD